MHYLTFIVFSFFLICEKSPILSADETLVYGETGSLDTFDPYTAREASAQRLSDLLFDSLVENGAGDEYIPALAKSWTISPDKTRIIFKLREGIYWHQDKKDKQEKSKPVEFSAQDVEKTIKIITNSVSEIPNRGKFTLIAGSRVIGKHEIEIIFHRAVFDPLVAMIFKILPAHKFRQPQITKDSDFVKAPLGTGPYMFDEAHSQGEMRLKANLQYFKGAPHIKEIIMKSYADQTVMTQSLLFKSLDLVTYVSPRDLSEVEGDASYHVVPYDGLSYSFIAMNIKNSFLKDKKVRQALSYAVNREEMLKAFFMGRGTLISGPIPLSSWAYNVQVKPISFSPEKSLNLLRDAGYADVKTIPELIFAVPVTGDNEMLRKMVLAYQSYLKKINVPVKLKFMDWGVWKEKVLGKNDYDLTIASWSFDDAQNIKSLFHSSFSVPWGNNFVNYKNNEVDLLLTEADAVNDPDKRRMIYHKLHAILSDEMPYTYLWTLQHHAAHHTKLSSISVQPFSFFRDIASWNIQNKGAM